MQQNLTNPIRFDLMAHALTPLPGRDFDVRQIAVPGRMFRESDQQVVFAIAQANPLYKNGVHRAGSP